MLKFVATTALTCCGFVCSVCDACNCASCDCGCPCGHAAAAAAPTAQPALATRGQEYRSYSYQPQPAPMYYQPNSRSSGRSAATGFHDAGWKVRGGF